MILKEFEGKQLLSQVGLKLPTNVLIAKESVKEDIAKVKGFSYPLFVKAQVMYGNRELEGLVVKVLSKEELTATVNQLFLTKDRFGQEISQVLIEESVNFSQAIYVSFTYSTQTRSPVLQISNNGGTGMDDRGGTLLNMPITLATGVTALPRGYEDQQLLIVLKKLFAVFVQNDASLLEINPLVKTANDYICLDAKIELEDSASFRHSQWQEYGERSQIAKPLTAVEKRAKEISRSDTRGVAGESFFEFPGGNVGVMASGGGASILAMDAILSEGLKPANYTEYSGNPTREKVKALTKLVLHLPHLEALYIVGSNANFTDIYETLAGVVDGVLESSIPNKFKILIRRGGPMWQEAFNMVQERLDGLMKKKQLKLKLFGPSFPIVKTARELKKMLSEVN